MRELRIRRDHLHFELRNARVRVARQPYWCAFCREDCIQKGDRYARISETRLPVCQRHFTDDDIQEVRQ